MASQKLFVGIDLGGTNMQIGVVDRSAKILSRIKKKTKADEGQAAIIDRLKTGILEALDAAGASPAQLAGVGIGAPGAIDPNTGVVLEAVNLRWNDVPLAKILKNKVDAPVYLDNDVNVAVFGEYTLGAVKDAPNILGVWLGTGVGGGLILNNELYYGPFFTAGEIGHTILLPNNPPGSRSFEHNCSRTALVERIVRLIKANRKSLITSLVDDDLSKIKSEILGKAYAKADPLTVEVVDDAAMLVGIAIANVCTLLSINTIVLGGGLTEALGQPFVDLVQKHARAFAFPDKLKKLTVDASRLQDDAGVLGAAILAMKAFR